MLREILNLLYIKVYPKLIKWNLLFKNVQNFGANEFVPVEFSRSIVKLSGKDADKKIDRWQKIAEMAAKQSKRDLIPKVQSLINIKMLSTKIDEYDLVLLAFENEDKNSLKNELLKIKDLRKNLKIAIIIGPEGGFEDSEVEILKEAGAKVVTLGKRILRTETAALSMASIIMYELED